MRLLKILSSSPKSLSLFIGIFLSILIVQKNFTTPALVGYISAIIGLYFIYYGYFLLAGLFLAVFSMSQINQPYHSDFNQCLFTGTVIKVSAASSIINSNQIHCKNNRLPEQNILYNHHRKKSELIEGRRYTFIADLSPINGRHNYYGFDYARYRYLQQILLQTNKIKIQEVSHQPYSFIIKWRNSIRNQLENNLSISGSSVIRALILGDRQQISDRVKQQLQDIGASHILAISGLHLGIVGGWVFLISQVFFALLPRTRYTPSPIILAAIFTLLSITLYAAISGFLLPVRRAWIMLSLFLISIIFLKRINTNSLFLAAIIILLVDPLAIYQIGFYLSFIATYIVISISQIKISFIIKVILMQAAITTTLLPIIWFSFAKIPIVAILSNLLIIPWVSIWVLPSAFLSILIEYLSPTISPIFWQITQVTTDNLLSVLYSFASLEWTIDPSFIPLKGIIITSTILFIISITYLNYYSILWAILGVIVLFIPITNTQPTIIIADSRKNSILIHDQEQAVIIDPGRKYRKNDDAKKWIRYLKLKRLELKAIILTNSQISRISSTSTLIKSYPFTKVIRLKTFDTPYKSQYCYKDRLDLDQIRLSFAQSNLDCFISIKWLDHMVILNTPNEYDSNNIYIKNSTLFFSGKSYLTRSLGAVKVTKPNKKFVIEHLK